MKTLVALCVVAVFAVVASATVHTSPCYRPSTSVTYTFNGVTVTTSPMGVVSESYRSASANLMPAH